LLKIIPSPRVRNISNSAQSFTQLISFYDTIAPRLIILLSQA
jgi:hypothetical protein